MTPTLLIAGNFLREQRWFILMLLLYIVMLSSLYLFVPHGMLQEFVLLLRQLAILALLFSLSLASGAIYNERRTRRLLAVLSKGVSRTEYLAGHVLGSLAISAIYCAGMLAIALILHVRIQLPLMPVLKLIGVTLIVCVLINNIALFFSTLLHPLFAMIATAVLLAVPYGVAQSIHDGEFALNALPVALLLSSISDFSFISNWQVPVATLWICLAESVLFWLAAGWVFSKRDVAVAVE